jgi:hypothetical protein
LRATTRISPGVPAALIDVSPETLRTRSFGVPLKMNFPSTVSE